MPAGVPSNQPTSAFAIPGTRKWLDGQVLTSSGHPHLDSILGGGLPLGTMILLEEDCKGIHANTLAQLFTAEGIACHHTVVVTGHDGTRSAAAFLSSLPLNVSSDSRDAAAAAASKSSTSNSNSSGLAGPGAAPDDDQHTDNADEIENLDGSDSADAAVSSTPDDAAGDGLKIAWQYKKYLPGQQQQQPPPPVPPASNGTTSASPPPPPPRVTKYCHTFDLNRRMHADVLSSCGAVVLPSVDDVSDGEAATMQLRRSASSASSSSAAGGIEASQSQTRQTSAIKSALKGSSSSSSAAASSKGAGKRSSSRLPSNVAELVLLAQSRGLIDDDITASAAAGGGEMTPAAAAMLLSNFIASRCSRSPDAAAVYGSLLEKIHDCCLGLPALHHPNRHQHVMQRHQLPSTSSHGSTPRPPTPSRPITPGASISTGGQLVATAAASIPGAARRSSFVGLHLPSASPPSTPGRPTVASPAVGTATVTSATSVDGMTTPVAVPALGNRPTSVEGGASSVPSAVSSLSARRSSAAGFGASASTPVSPSPVAVEGSSGTPTTASSTGQPTNVTRITVLGCGGPLWPGWTGSDVHAMACVPGAACLPDDKVCRQYRPLVSFISGLRRTIEIDNSGSTGTGSSNSAGGGGAVVLVTMPTHSMPLSVAAHIRSHFDVVIKVHAFGDPAYALATNRATARQHLLPTMVASMGPLAGAASTTSSAANAGTDTAPEYRDYHGLLLIRRLARVGSLVPPSLPDTLTWVFKRDRKKMAIEKPHLPPELDDTRTADTTTSSTSASATGAQAAAAAGTAGGHAHVHAHDASCGCATGHGTNSNTTFTAAGGADGKVKFSNSVSVHVATRPSAADASAAVIRGVDSGAAASSGPGSKDTTRALKPAGVYPSHASAGGRATSSSNSGGLGAFMGSGLSHHQLDHVDPSRSRSGFAGLLDDEDDDEGSGGVVHSHRDRTSGYYGRQSAVVPPSVPAAVTHTSARAPPLEPGMACAAAAAGGSGRSRTGAAGGAAQGAAAAGTGSAARGGGSLEF